MTRKTRCGRKPAPCSSRPSSSTASSSSPRARRPRRALGAAGRRVRDRAAALDHRRPARRGARGGAGRDRRTDADHRRARPLPSKGRNANIVRLEIPYGRFERRITLSPRLRLSERELGQWLSRAHFRQVCSQSGSLVAKIMNDTEHSTPQSAEARSRVPSEAQAARGRALLAGNAAARSARRRAHPLADAQCRAVSRHRGAAHARPPAVDRRRPSRRPRPTSRSACCCRSDASVETPGPERSASRRHVGRDPALRDRARRQPSSGRRAARGAFACSSSCPAIPFLVARVDEVGEAEVYSTEIAARMHQLKERAREAISLLPNVPTEIAGAIEQMQSPSQLADFIANVSDLTPAEKQDVAGDLRCRRAARQAAALSRPADRGAAPVEADRRADARVAVRPAARAHAARAAAPDPEGARRRRGGPGRDRRAARGDRQGRHAGGGREAGAQGAEAARAHARGVGRVRHGAHLSRLADRAAVVDDLGGAASTSPRRAASSTRTITAWTRSSSASSNTSRCAS